MFNNVFFENRTVYEIKWKNIIEPNRPQMTVWRMRITRWIPKATNTHPGYVIFFAFPLRQWLHQPATMLRYTKRCVKLYVCTLPLLPFSYGIQ
jgi:hypothetical protein